MNKLKLTNFANILTLLLIMVIPSYSWGLILFEDNFNNQADWSPVQTLTSKDCTDNCSTLPAGYNAYRIQGSCFANGVGHNTLNIDSTNYRGNSGKAFTFWSEGCGDKGGWFSDGLLGVYLPDSYPELYMSVYIKFQPGWQWWTGGTTSPEQKFLRIAHYDGGGSPFVFFESGNTKPLTTILLSKWRSGLSNIALMTNYRYENVYYPASATPSHSSDNTNYLGTGNYNGTGQDFWDPGMIGDGNWHQLEYYVKLNSAVGVPDGIMRVWIDGKLVAEQTNLAWGDVGAQESPRKLWNYIMLGGNDFNKFASYTEGKEQWYAIDDFVVSTTYIAPDYVIGGGSTPPPPLDKTPPDKPYLNP